MNTPPQQQPNTPNYRPQEELTRLRLRLNDLLRLEAATPATFQQAIMQIWQESERRRQSCLSESEDHLRRYHALLAQAHGFSALSSIVFAVINGYVELEEKRVREEAERAHEKAAQAAEALKEAELRASAEAAAAQLRAETAAKDASDAAARAKIQAQLDADQAAATEVQVPPASVEERRPKGASSGGKRKKR